MTPQEHENGLRSVAKRCHTELKKYDKLTTELSKQTISKYLPEFTNLLPPDKKRKYTPNMWFNHYVMTIDKEINDDRNNYL
ncbi:Uncharacterised protein [Providencia rustigianii]|nr:Uncharacterised protein [Providencia rustigianii]